MPEPLEQVYRELRERMLCGAAGMIAARDGEGELVMHAPWAHPSKPKVPMWFGAVEIRKAYVSFHLMPIYMNPVLQAAVSPALKKRMQGKACFNFNAVDPALFDELESLTAKGAAFWAQPLKIPGRT